MSKLIKKILFPAALCLAVFILTLTAAKNFANPTKKTIADTYFLKSYKNTVALYNGDKIVEIYNNIVLNTLPEKDIITFNNGIAVTTPAQAEIILEDYDS